MPSSIDISNAEMPYRSMQQNKQKAQGRIRSGFGIRRHLLLDWHDNFRQCVAMGEHDKPLGVREKPDVHFILQSIMPIGYRWPASRLNSVDMERLCIIRHATREPITQLLQKAVNLLWEKTEQERNAFNESRGQKQTNIRMSKNGTIRETEL